MATTGTMSTRVVWMIALAALALFRFKLGVIPVIAGCAIAGLRLRVQFLRGRVVVRGGLFFVHGCSPLDRCTCERAGFEPLLDFGNAPCDGTRADAIWGRKGPRFDCCVNGRAG